MDEGNRWFSGRDNIWRRSRLEKQGRTRKLLWNRGHGANTGFLTCLSMKARIPMKTDDSTQTFTKNKIDTPKQDRLTLNLLVFRFSYELSLDFKQCYTLRKQYFLPFWGKLAIRRHNLPGDTSYCSNLYNEYTRIRHTHVSIRNIYVYVHTLSPHTSYQLYENHQLYENNSEITTTKSKSWITENEKSPISRVLGA